MLLFISAVGIVLVVSFLCSIFESVLLSLTRPQIELLRQRRRRAGALLARFKENPDVPIAAILILNTAAHTIGASVAGASYSNVFDASTLWLFSILFTLAVLLFTEIIPKTLGVTYATLLATPVAHGIRLLTVMLRPLVTVSERISRSLRGDAVMPVTSAEEIRLLASLGRREGAVGVRTASMIVGATHLRHLQAHNIMLPRTEVHFLSAGMNRDTAMRYVRETGHSRFPFSPSESLEDVSGVVLAKELLYWMLQHDDQEIDWESVRREALFVPRTALISQLLQSFQDNRRHLAIIVDEYGSVEGIATLEDVLEEIVGDIRDESDRPVDDISENADGTLVVQASVDLRRLSTRLGITWQPGTDVSTIGGLVTESLERIPVVGDTIRWSNYEIVVRSADRKQARSVIVRPIQE